ncbi:MAG: hypothetical protein JXB62_04045 [Pirellulales bacterium]|nr:hypothetical protein [Pirellulales bacterium]
MKFNQLVILLPCHSLEDFSLNRQTDEADQVLSAWSALWHPSLLGVAQSMPTWHPADAPPSQPASYLIVIPQCSRDLLPEGWVQQAQSEGACVIDGQQSRQQMVAEALQRLDGGPTQIAQELLSDFLALGFCHLQVELLTRQLRYMSNLDEDAFRRETLAAAQGALEGDEETARSRLRSAFDLLHEGREYFYPVEAHLLDLTLVAPTTLGKALRAELARPSPINLLVTGEAIEALAREEPETLRALAGAIEKGTAAIVGGEFYEPALPLLTPEAIGEQLRRGLDAYQRHLGCRPTIFGRRRFGLSPVLPQILRRYGFTGAVHSTLDDGRFPTGNQSRIQWQGLDGTVIEALGRVPLDASRAEAFLRLPERLGDAMDLDHVATVILAHWPGQTSSWYEDLRRIASYSTALGTFATIDHYFDQTGLAGQQTSYRPDQYRSPYLRQAVSAGQADPISRWARYFQRRAAVEAAATLDALATIVSGRAAEQPADGANEHARPAAERLLDEVEDCLNGRSDSGEELDRTIEGQLHEATERFSGALGSGPGPDDGQGPGFLVANPCSFSRRLCVEVPGLPRAPETAGAVRAAADDLAIVDVPPMGFAWLGPGAGGPPAAKPSRTGRTRRRAESKEDPPLAEENTLRNEFFEVTIDPHTGAIQSIADYYSRGARLAQQIAMRLAPVGRHDDGDDEGYSLMAADQISVTSVGPIIGEIVCRGRLVDRQARRLAGFAQTTRIRRGSRVIELRIDLDVERPLDRDPWHSYYAVRFAWGDATANLYRSVNLANCPTDVLLLEAPHFIDVRAGKARTTLLTGGLPYHRRFGLRKIDTLLAVHGERARSFRLGIGVDLPHPVPAALDFVAPKAIRSATVHPPAPSGWLFHVDCRNVIATHWEPVLSQGRVEGFRVRLLETDGRKTEVGLRAFRPLQSAEKINAGETPPTQLCVQADQVTVPMGPHNWIDVEGRFAD